MRIEIKVAGHGTVETLRFQARWVGLRTEGPYDNLKGEDGQVYAYRPQGSNTWFIPRGDVVLQFDVLDD